MQMRLKNITLLIGSIKALLVISKALTALTRKTAMRIGYELKNYQKKEHPTNYQFEACSCLT